MVFRQFWTPESGIPPNSGFLVLSWCDNHCSTRCSARVPFEMGYMYRDQKPEVFFAWRTRRSTPNITLSSLCTSRPGTYWTAPSTSPVSNIPWADSAVRWQLSSMRGASRHRSRKRSSRAASSAERRKCFGGRASNMCQKRASTSARINSVSPIERQNDAGITPTPPPPPSVKTASSREVYVQSLPSARHHPPSWRELPQIVEPEPSVRIQTLSLSSPAAARRVLILPEDREGVARQPIDRKWSST